MSAKLEEGSPERTCVVTRSVESKERLLRFVLAPDGQIVPDLKNKLPGRGIWVTANAEILGKAVKRQSFKRALKGGPDVDAGLVTLVGDLLEKDALQSLALANKAGLVMTGAMKIGSALSEGGLMALIHATDGTADGHRKLLQSAPRSMRNGESVLSVINLFESHQMDLALGRTNVIHAALLPGAAAAAFVRKSARLSFFRGTAAKAETSGSLC